MANINSITERAEYSVAIEALKKQGVNVDSGNRDVSQSYLRLEQTLQSDSNSFLFQVNDNTTKSGQAVQPTERRLSPQDAFYCSRLAYWIEAYTIGGDNPDLYRYMPMTFPTYQGIEAGVFLSNKGYKLWGGELKFTISGDVVIPAWDCKRHLFIPEGQHSSVNGAFPASEFYVGQNEFNGGESAFYPMVPNVVFIGNKKNEILLSFPENLADAIGDSPVVVKAVLTAYGVLAQNASKTA